MVWVRRPDPCLGDQLAIGLPPPFIRRGRGKGWCCDHLHLLWARQPRASRGAYPWLALARVGAQHQSILAPTTGGHEGERGSPLLGGHMNQGLLAPGISCLIINGGSSAGPVNDAEDADDHQPYSHEQARFCDLHSLISVLQGALRASPRKGADPPYVQRIPISLIVDNTRYLEYLESEDFLAKSRQTSLNRNTVVEGPETGVSKHGGGSMSIVTTNERLIRVVLCSAPEETYEPTHATPDQAVDDEAMYYDMGVSPMVPCSEFDNVAEQLRQVVVLMQRQFGITIDEAGLSQPPPLPPPPHDQQKAQTNPADPPQ
ncbi:hypothetical protein Syun_002238 [Stephania yunnanensis]|uniref:Uncharacterized protein n=1 Tax=Stephania yunnanensis TaxID=152371 RepID=A0AAP0LF45_9MAGN